MLTSLHRVEDYRPRISGAGFITLDVALDAEHRVTYSGIGGTTGNVLSILAFLGWTSTPLVRLGRDKIGATIHYEFEQLGADVSHLQLDPSLTTPLLYQFSAALRESPRYSFACPMCGTARRFSPALVDSGAREFEGYVASSNVFFFDRVTAGTVSLAAAARKSGALVFFEPSMVTADKYLFDCALQAAHVVKYSAERIDDSCDMLPEGGMEIRTRGSKGLSFRKHSLAPDWVELPALKASEISDTAGAGDWCTAGFLYQLFAAGGALAFDQLSYNDIYYALRLGQAIAALSVRHVGARGLMRELTSDIALSLARRVVVEGQTPAVAKCLAARQALDLECCDQMVDRIKRSPPLTSSS